MAQPHKSHKPKLEDVHRTFLVREFSCFSTPTEAARALKQEFGIEISPQGAQHYDVTSGAGARAAKRWHELFDVSRQAFLDDVKERIPHGHKSVRIQKLARAADAFEKNKNYMGMARMLEQLAREMGDAFSNRRELTGRKRGPIQFEDVSSMTDDEIDEELRQLLNVKDDADVYPAPKGKQ